MPSAPHPYAALERLLSTYWFVPALLTASAVVLSILLTAIDRAAPDATAWLGWAYNGGAEGARALLSAVAGSMITVVSVTFSVLVVALTVSSQHFGPRLLRSFMRDQPAQLVLGTFTGTFVYCLMVLRSVQGDGGDRFSFFVPHLAVAGAIVLALVAVGMLIYYVHHVAVSMQVSEIASRIAGELERTIDRLYPEPIGEGTEPPVRTPPPEPVGAMHVEARSSGYVQAIDDDTILATAVEHGTTIWLTARPGDFVVAGEPIAAIHPIPPEALVCAGAVARTYVIGTDRTPEQDAAFGVQQLVEMALRALSPGTNEPFTAVTVIDRLRQALSKLAARRIPSAMRTDEAGHLRAITRPRTFDALLDAAFEPVVLYAGRNPAIAARLLHALARLADVAQRLEDRAALARMADFVWDFARREIRDERHRAELGHLHVQVQQRIGEDGTRASTDAKAS